MVYVGCGHSKIYRIVTPNKSGKPVGERTSLAWADQAAGFYYVVVDAISKNGFTSEEIEKVGGGNFLRVFGESEPPKISISPALHERFRGTNDRAGNPIAVFQLL
jgi:hypothetical protein